MIKANKDDARRAPAGQGTWPGWLRSRAYRKSRSKAADYMDSREKLSGLLDKATLKATGKRRGLGEVWGSLQAFFRLIRAYANGSYRRVSAQSMLTILAAVAYFVSPIDLIPDFILGLGLIDDVTVLAWTIRACAGDIAAFVAWEQAAGERTP